MPKRQPAKSSQPNLEAAQMNREFLSASLAPETANAENRTVDVVFFTGIDVPRLDFWTGDSYILRFDPKGADLSLLNSGAPVLDNHSLWEGVAAQKGVVEKAWMEDSLYKASLRFSRRPEVDGLWRDIEDKIVQKFSMGTEILETEFLSEKDSKGGNVKVRLARKWRPFELSVTPVPADFSTTTLAVETADHTRATARREEHQMSEVTEKTIETVPTAEQTQAIGEQAAAAERARIVALHKIGRAVNLDAPFIDTHLEKGTGIEEFRKLALEQIAARSEAEAPTRSHSAIMTVDARDNMRLGIESYLMHRCDPAKHPVDDRARPYVGLSMLDIGRECLIAASVPWRGKDKMEVVRMAFMSTGDFPLVLAATAGKRLRAGYEEAPRTFLPWCSRGTAPDYKNLSLLQLGAAPNLEQVAEGASIKVGSLPESREQYHLLKYAKILPITREAIINDDLRAFNRIPQMQGAACARLENATVYSILTVNANMADVVPLFNAGHANLITPGTAINIANLGIARSTMRLQTGLLNADGTRPLLNVQLAFLIVPSALELLAQQYTLVAGLIPTLQTAVNPFAGTLTTITEPLLDADSAARWYGAANPAQFDTIEYCYLEGQQGPRYESRVGFEVEGMEFKVALDFAAKAVDWRGLLRNGA